MQLIGMLDSPYVRRVAISLRYLGIAFEHKSVSVFSTFEQFQRINPVVKAPTLVCDDGEVLMDSTLILEYAEALAAPQTLMPSGIAERQHALRIIGLAIAACEKTVQTVYERNLRPPEKHHEPWLARIRGQMLAAYGALETEAHRKPLTMDQAGITAAVAWKFTLGILPGAVTVSEYPALQEFSAQAERLAEFIAFPPDGPGVPAAR